MDIAELENKFAMPGVLAFEKTASGLAFVRVTAPSAAATVYLHGAHLTDWHPAGQAPVLFLSARTELAADKAIRGGVPVIFPWFGPRHDGKEGPMHGFARVSEWEMAFAAVAGDEVHLRLLRWLDRMSTSRALGFDHFRLAYRMTIGPRLTLELTVANVSGVPLVFEEALHSYFAVADVRKATVTGLAEATYIDKRDEMRRKVQPAGAMAITGTTDRVYLDTTPAACVIDDRCGARGRSSSRRWDRIRPWCGTRGSRWRLRWPTWSLRGGSECCASRRRMWATVR